MFRELRENYGLTRSQLADLTGRTQNYILKAEQLTFPSAPVSLLDFYCKDKPPAALSDALSEVWEPLEKYTLELSYRESQRHKREMWLDYMEPAPSSLSFCKQWVFKQLDDEVDEITSPTEYRVSQGLCIPAPAVYRAEKHGHISQPIKTALEDLVEYVASGRYYAKHGGYYADTDDAQRVVTGTLEIAKKYGVEVHNDRLSA